MATRTAPRAGRRATPRDARPLSAGEAAWIAAGPAALASALAVLAFAKPLGRLLFGRNGYDFWPSSLQQLLPKPTQLAAYLLVVVAALGLAATVAAVGARGAWRLSASGGRRALLGTQLLLLAAAVACWTAQRHVVVWDTSREYFTVPTLLVATGLTAMAALALTRPHLLSRLSRPAPASATWRFGCALVAVAATAIWLLPAIATDGDVGAAPVEVVHHLAFAFDEAMSVLDGRSPLVNMAAYGTLWPYALALPLTALGASLAAFTALMTALTALSLLAVYGVLQRVTRHAPAALALYLPFLATSLFWVLGDSAHRYGPGQYFGIFPLRYTGPYLLAWLTARQLDGVRPRRMEALFAVGGFVVLNNLDFGLPALAATVLALLCARPPRDREAVLRLGKHLAAGLAIALALVSALTLLRAGSLPRLGLLVRYGRLFGTSGFGDAPTALVGFHLVVLATAVAALLVGVVRAIERHPDATLTGMLAWSGLFGLGAGAYFMYRSHPDVLVDLFSIWSLTLALLLVAIARSVARRRPRRLAPAEVGVLFAFGLAACSLAQLPLPWRQVERIGAHAKTQPYDFSKARDFIAAHTRRGEPVAILTSLGHRLAYESGVVNVSAYTGIWQMPTVQQLEETIRTLRAAGGGKVFLGSRKTEGDTWWPELPDALESAGFVGERPDPASGFVEFHDAGV